MKKPLFWIPLFLCLLLSLSSCASPLKTDAEGSEVQNGNVTTGEVDCIDLRFFKESEIPLEPDKTDLPSYAVLSSITPGMTKEEVFSLVGNPQRVETRMISNRPGTSIAEKKICYVYDSSDGGSLFVLWGYLGLLEDDPVVLNTSPGEQPQEQN